MFSLDTPLVTEVTLQSFGIDASFSSDGQLIVVVSTSGISHLVDLKGSIQAELKAYEVRNDPYVHSHSFLTASFSPDGQSIITGLTDGTARLWDLNGNELLVLKGHQGDVVHAGFASQGSRIVTSSLDGTVRLWDLNGNQLTIVREPHQHFSQDEGQFDGYFIRHLTPQVSFSSDNQLIVFCSDEESQEPAELWDINGNKRATFQVKQEEVIRPTVFSPSSQTIVTNCTDGTVKLWSLEGTVLKTFPDVKASRLSFSPDGKLLAIASAYGNMTLWDLESGHKLKEREKVHDFLNISALSFSPNGQLILTAGFNDATVKLWDLNLNEVSRLHRGANLIPDLSERVTDSGQIACAKFSPDGKYIVALSRQALSSPGYLMLWQVELKSPNAQQKSSSRTADSAFQEVLVQAKRLPLSQRLRLIREVTHSVEQELNPSAN